MSEKSKLTLMSLLFNPRKGEDRIYEVDLGETFSCGQSNSMRMPYETVSVTTAGKSHGFVWCAPYADHRRQQKPNHREKVQPRDDPDQETS